METAAKNGLNIPYTCVIGTAYFGINVVLCIYNPLLSLFISKYTDSTFLIGMMITLGYIISAIVQPYFGARSDNTYTKIGKRKPYLLIGMPFAALFFLLIPYEQGLFSLIMFIIGFNVMMSVYRVPTMSLMPDLTPKHLWNNANGIINFIGGIGALVAYFIGSKLYDYDPHAPFIAGASITVLTLVLILVFVRERSTPIVFQPEKEKRVGVIKAIWQIAKDKDKSALLILLSVLFRFLAYSGIESFIVLYSIKHLGLGGSQGTYVLAIMSLTFILAAIPSGIAATKFGRKKTITVGLAMFFAAMLGYIFAKDFLIMALLSPLGGIGYAFVNTNVFPMLLNTADESKIGAYAGLYYFSISLAYIIGPTIFGKVIDLAGYESLFIFAAFLIAAAFLCFINVKNDDNELFNML